MLEVGLEVLDVLDSDRQPHERVADPHSGLYSPRIEPGSPVLRADAAEQAFHPAAHVTIQDLGSIGELVAAAATIATLAYLAAQVRQNTRALRSSTFQSISDARDHAVIIPIISSSVCCVFFGKAEFEVFSLSFTEAAKSAISSLDTEIFFSFTYRRNTPRQTTSYVLLPSDFCRQARNSTFESFFRLAAALLGSS